MNPNRIYLFGSYAKDTQRADSDYDFYIIMPDDAGNEILLGQKAYRSLRGIRKTPVDIVVGHENAFERLKNQPTLEREVFRDGVILYEK
ncbi:MAG: nucleotidyltransferase domain-containing protein [Treponema sp.]|nr:nucleotidyltransferase domain-containing protein [Treponema sp.]